LLDKKRYLDALDVEEMLSEIIPQILFIDERIMLYKELGFCNYNIDKLEEWVNTKGLFNREHFYEYLSLKGLTVDDIALAFKNLTKEERKKVLIKARQLECVKIVEEIVSNYLEEYKRIGFDSDNIDLDISLLPFTYYFSKKLNCILEKISNFQLEKKAIENVVKQLSQYLIQLTIKAVINELHLDKEKGLLEGATGEERFKSFVKDRFINPEKLIDFYRTYPVLLRRLAKKTKNFTEFIEKMLTDLDRNFEKICTKIGIKSKANLITRIECGKGDVHEKGKFTAIIELGYDRKLVYKPRCLKIKEKFEEFLSWINENAKAVVPNFLDLIVNKGLYEEDFTIEEFVTYDSCETEKEIKRFYIRLGEISALIYLLGGNDIHYENVIAHREYPIVVDLESLFQGEIGMFGDESEAQFIAYKKIMESIGRTGILPLTIGAENFDLSAVGGDKQKVPYKVLKLVDAGTDDMRLEYDDAEIEAAENIPLLKGKKVDYKNYVEDIMYGIKMMFNFFIKKRDECLDKLEIFRGIKVRKIIRSTQNYARMMEYSTHPVYLADAARFERLYLNMWAYPYKNKEIVLSEIKDLLNDDIPIFYGFTDSKVLIDSDGRKIEDCYDEDSFDEVKKLISKIDEDFLEEQIIHATVALGLFEKSINKKFECIGRLNLEISDISLENKEKLLLSSIRFLYNKIMEEVIWDKNKKTCSWLCPIYDSEKKIWKLSPLDIDFLNGIGGVYLFLNYCSELLTEAEMELKNLVSALEFTLYKGIESYISEAYKRKKNKFIASSINRIASALYALLVTQKKEKNQRLFDIVASALEVLRMETSDILSDNVISDINVNVLIKILIELYKYTGFIECLKLAEVFLNHNYQKLPYIMTAKNDVYRGTGMLSIILYEFSAVTGDVTILEHAKELLNRSFRQYINTEDYSFYSGLSGLLICLSRVFNNESEFSNFFPLVKELVRKIGSKRSIDDSVFYGTAGEIEAILSIYEIARDKEIKDIADKKVQHMLMKYKRIGNFGCKSLEKFRTIYFSQGLSGIGYTLLRICNFSKLPNVLLFDT